MYSRQKQVALSRTRLDREKAEAYAGMFYCYRHPTEVRSADFQCESCIRSGYELRTGMVGGRRVIYVPRGL